VLLNNIEKEKRKRRTRYQKLLKSKAFEKKRGVGGGVFKVFPNKRSRLSFSQPAKQFHKKRMWKWFFFGGGGFGVVRRKGVGRETR